MHREKSQIVQYKGEREKEIYLISFGLITWCMDRRPVTPTIVKEIIIVMGIGTTGHAVQP